MDRAQADKPQGWEHLWSGEREITGYWIEPQSHVREWVQSLDQSVRRVLDLGCGLGRHTLYLNQQGLRGAGSDIAPSGLAVTSSKLRSAGFSPLLVVTPTSTTSCALESRCERIGSRLA